MLSKDNDIQVGKLDVVRRLLKTAIVLFFQDKDVVSIATLVECANSVLREFDRSDVAAKNRTWRPCKNKLWDKFDAEGKKGLNYFFNFLKHSQSDPREILTISAEYLHMMIMDTILSLTCINGEKEELYQRYFLWFYKEYPDWPAINDEIKEKAKEVPFNSCDKYKYLTELKVSFNFDNNKT